MKIDLNKAQNSSVQLSKYLQGQFSEHLGRGIYGGLWVGKDSNIPNVNGLRSDVIEALKKIHVPVLRWPGGCFADEYHWRDGIGDPAGRRKIVNNNWGGTTEDNSFGTHEFFELCRQLNTEAYINVNVGSGSVREMADWIEYMTGSGDSTMANLRATNGHPEPWEVKFLGIGNETWGGGGNMRPEYYADVYRQFQTFVRQYGKHPLYKIACGPNVDDYNWTDVLMERAAPYMDGLSLHHYALTDVWENKGDAVNFSEDEWNSLLYSAKRMDWLINEHTKRMDRYDPQHRVDLIVDEWGSWLSEQAGTNPAFLYQQNTIRDAMVAATTLNIFNKHAERIHMANIAQMVNVLQAMILTKGSQMVLTPTYFVFQMYQFHQDAKRLSAFCSQGADLNYTISEKDGEYILSFCNTSLTTDESVEVTMPETIGAVTYNQILHSDKANAHNTFDEPDQVKMQKFNQVHAERKTIRLRLPKMSVITLKYKK
ncbi:alpha-N-arabinofuranosidase [Levilactobacillus brevis]|uniref:alpha-N-arabinofuranosidase n=1 Tax=Levilactobacillus brevis TaxID=1580 RepID=UPI001BA6D15B|nr:alpha-L-arabinofuranosidase C-terminal domain-containing protein [Levilactobacillus brevis]MBS1006016.1 alpha-N-arabinofuranosidase [Levilactobacillus brevis]MBS1013198.1 alpha-N-arabinofuranosidase [Levilactobacillus brevis]